MEMKYLDTFVQFLTEKEKEKCLDKESDLKKNVISLQQKCALVSSFCDQYDFRNIECNGFRSFLKMIDIWMEWMVQNCKKEKESDFIQMTRFMNRMVDFLIDYHHGKGTDAFMKNHLGDLLSFPLEEARFFVDIRGIYLNRKDQVLLPVLSFSQNWKTLTVSRAVGSMFSKDRQRWVQVQRQLDGTADAIRAANHKTRRMSMKEVVNTKLDSGNKSLLFLPRVNKWKVICDRNSSAPSTLVQMGPTLEPEDEELPLHKVICFHRKKKHSNVDPEKEDMILLRIMGGAYVHNDPVTVEKFTSIIGKELKVPSFIPHYRVGHEDPYPAALNDLLDVYLYLTSSEMIQVVGYVPKKVIVTGDSAGGNLALTLLYSLKQLQSRGVDLIMPQVLHLIYPNISPTLKTFPSRVFFMVDPFIQFGPICSAVGAYHGLNPIGQIYHRDEEDWIHHRDTMYYRVRDPFCCGDFEDDVLEQLKDTPLICSVGEFDPLLDESVFLCSKWKGPVHLDVVKGVTHGFTVIEGIFKSFSKPEAVRTIATQIDDQIRGIGPATIVTSVN